MTRLFRAAVYFGRVLAGISLFLLGFLGLSEFFSRAFDVSFDIGAGITTAGVLTFTILRVAWELSE